jgi:hypothetical protein
MDETTNAAVETPAADWDNWDSLDLSDLTVEGGDTDTEGVPATAQEEPTAESGEAATDTGADADGEDNGTAEGTFELNIAGQSRKVSQEELVALAQKGLDYDNVRGQLDAMNAQQEAAQTEAQSFLTELAQAQGITVPELMNRVRAENMAQKEGIDLSVALGRVQNQNEARELQRQREQLSQSQSQSAAQEQRQTAIQAFVAQYPDVKAQDIPRGVWDEFSRTGDLVAAYRTEENRQLREQVKTLTTQLETEKNNKKNKDRSTGSQKGETTRDKDPFLAAWYDGN